MTRDLPARGKTLTLTLILCLLPFAVRAQSSPAAAPATDRPADNAAPARKNAQPSPQDKHREQTYRELEKFIEKTPARPAPAKATQKPEVKTSPRFPAALLRSNGSAFALPARHELDVGASAQENETLDETYRTAAAIDHRMLPHGRLRSALLSEDSGGALIGRDLVHLRALVAKDGLWDADTPLIERYRHLEEEDTLHTPSSAIGDVDQSMGASLAALGWFCHARSYLFRSLLGRRAAWGNDSPLTQQALRVLAQLAIASKHPNVAARYEKKIQK